MRAIVAAFRKSPAVRMVARSIAVAIAGYVADSLKGGVVFSWSALAIAAGTAAGYAILGIFTPVEPLVGNKTRVDVPVPPAQPERAR